MLENENIKITGFVPKTSTYLHQSHVSVAPLRYGAGMKGKIGEAMAHGVPVVTTSIGAQGMGLTDRENILIADSPQSFAAAVLELLNDSCMYKKIRKNAIQIIDDNYA
jgi:glycosyltransferase involved in cell wall biosynthesis